MYETVTVPSKPWCYPLPVGLEETTLIKQFSMVNLLTGSLDFDSHISKCTIGNMRLPAIIKW